MTKIDGPAVVGLCAIEALREKFVNAGNLDERVRVYAAARVGGPSALIFSDDLGKTWSSIDLAAAGTAMVFDVHFFDRDHGLLAAASDADIAGSNALILTIADGGKTWAPTDSGNAVNKVRMLSTDQGTHAFSIGVGVGKNFVPR